MRSRFYLLGFVFVLVACHGDEHAMPDASYFVPLDGVSSYDSFVPFDSGFSDDSGSTQGDDVSTVDVGFPHPTRWGTPQPLSSVNSSSWDTEGTMTIDMLTICFNSWRGGGAGSGDIWCARRGSPSDDFGPATNQSGINTAAREGMPALSADGHEIFFIREGSGTPANWDIFRGTWDAAAESFMNARPVSELNTPGQEAGPALSLDGRTIYFASVRTGGVNLTDIWKATRQRAGGSFGTPQLVRPVSGDDWDDSPSLSPDGNELAFSRMSTGIGSPTRIYLSQRSGSSWAAPTLVHLLDNPMLSESAPEILADGSLLFEVVAASSSSGQYDLYIAPPR